MKRKEKDKKEKVNKVQIIFNIITIAISLSSLAISICGFMTSQDSLALEYYINPVVTRASNNQIHTDLEIMVTNGAVTNVRVFDYRDGKITKIANNVGGVIRKSSSPNERTFKFVIDYEPMDEFIASEYLLIHGKDGSKKLDMILYHINTVGGEGRVKYYSQEELIFSELDQEERVYANALTNYRELVNLLKEQGEL